MPDFARATATQTTKVETSPSADDAGFGHRAARGGVVVIAAQALRLALLLISLVVLGRLLSPADFGVFAFALALVGVAELLRDFGLSSSAVSARHLTPAEKSNLFWMNTSLGFGLTVIIASAGAIGVAIHPHSSVSFAMIGLSLVYLMNGVQTQFQVELTRSFRFTAIAATDIASQTVGLAIAIIAAVQGAGYWSLVIMQVAISITLLAGRASTARWRPGRPRFDVPMRQHLQYGWGLGMSQALSYFSINAPIYALGAFAGANGVGIYSRAAQVVNVPMNQVFAPLTNVALPSLSRVYGKASFHEHMRGVTNLVALVGAVSFMSLFAIAPWFTPLILGPSWSDATRVLQWLCVGAMFQSLTFPFFWVFLASRRTRDLLNYSLISKPLSVLMVTIGAATAGTTGAAIGLTLGFATAWPMCAVWLRTSEEFDASEVFRDSLRILVMGMAGILIALTLHRVVDGLLMQSTVALLGAAVASLVVGAILHVQDSVHRSIRIVARVQRTAHAAPAGPATDSGADSTGNFVEGTDTC